MRHAADPPGVFCPDGVEPLVETLRPRPMARAAHLSFAIRTLRTLHLQSGIISVIGVLVLVIVTEEPSMFL